MNMHIPSSNPPPQISMLGYSMKQNSVLTGLTDAIILNIEIGVEGWGRVESISHSRQT